MKCDSCYKYRHCWACEEWLGCRRAPTGDCFVCDQTKCPENTGAPMTAPENLEDI
jgi:hypothetical protein